MGGRMNPHMTKTVQRFVKDTKKILQDNLMVEYLFGSYSKNEQTELSDIDILLIVKRMNPKIRRDVSSLASDYSVEEGVINSPILKDIKIWEKNKKHKTLFYSEIEKYGIEL